MKLYERRHFQNVSRPSNPPDKLAQNVSKKKNFFGRINSSICFTKVQILAFFIYLHDSNSIFRALGINSELFSGCTVSSSNVNVKSIYLHDTRRDVPDQVMEREQGSCKVFFHVHHFVVHQRAEALHSSPLFISETFTPRWGIQCQEAHPLSSCHHDFSRSWLGCRWFSWYGVAVSQQRQPQYYWRSIYGHYLAYATGLHTMVTRFQSGQLGRRLRISRTTWPSTLLESKWALDAFSIPRKSLGLRPTDHSCDHETWLHLDFVDRNKTWSRQKTYDPHMSLTERSAEGENRKRIMSEITCDHSLSS